MGENACEILSDRRGSDAGYENQNLHEMSDNRLRSLMQLPVSVNSCNVTTEDELTTRNIGRSSRARL